MKTLASAVAVKVAARQAERVAGHGPAAAPAQAPADAVEALRRRLGGTTAREHVVLDFLSDDLREAKEALAILAGYLGRIEAVVGHAEVTQQQLLSLALGGGPIEQIDYLAEMLSSVRRRLAQVAARM
jgi:hypothetical protein